MHNRAHVVEPGSAGPLTVIDVLQQTVWVIILLLILQFNLHFITTYLVI